MVNIEAQYPTVVLAGATFTVKAWVGAAAGYSGTPTGRVTFTVSSGSTPNDTSVQVPMQADGVETATLTAPLPDAPGMTTWPTLTIDYSGDGVFQANDFQVVLHVPYSAADLEPPA